MGNEHTHAWGPWSMLIPQYDSFGNLLMLAGKPWYAVATLVLTGRPVTPGWSRTCRCGAVEKSEATVTNSPADP